MTVFALLFLVWLALTESAVSALARVSHEQTTENGGGAISGAANITDSSSQHVRLRRSMVFTTVQPCYSGFFAGGQPPTGFRTNQQNLRFICQQAPGNANYLYSTKFDLQHGIPIYAGYVITRNQAGQFGAAQRSGNSWRQQPGIALQGSDQMYAGNTAHIQKGHLVPAQTYSFSVNHIKSTFWYTNAVPQYQAFNVGRWRVHEGKVRAYATNVCSANNGHLYLLTGISEVQIGPGTQVAAPMGLFSSNVGANQRIAIPNSMWTAGCCILPNGAVHGAFAFTANNVQTTNQIHMSAVTVAQLQGFLLTGVGGAGGPAINLFPGYPGCSAPANQVQV